LCFRRHLSPRDLIARPHLYKVNQMTTTDMKINLAIILTNEDGPPSEIPDMPDEDEIIRILQDDGNDQVPGQDEGISNGSESEDLLVNEPCIVFWDDKDDKRE
jgi:hypothetical protein